MRSILTIAGLLLFATRLAVLGGGEPAAWMGTWTLNLEKSVSPGQKNFKRVTCTIEPWKDGIRVSYDIVGLRGGITHTEWIGLFDGRNYPVEGVDAAMTNAYTLVDDHTYDVATKVEGRPQASARTTVSTDGKTLTSIVTQRDAKGATLQTTTVYEKRR